MKLGSDSHSDHSEVHGMTKFLPLVASKKIMQLRHQIAAAYGFDSSNIEDIYSCMPIQVSMFSLGSQNSAGYIMHGVLNLNPKASVEKFRTAWEHIHRSTAILQTRIVHDESYGFLQVVLREEIS